jgi:hypothetical protein
MTLKYLKIVSFLMLVNTFSLFAKNPDLIISSFTQTDSRIYLGSSHKVTVTLSNIGTSPTDAGFRTSVYLEDDMGNNKQNIGSLWVSSFNVIQPGESLTRTFDVFIPSVLALRPHRLHAWADTSDDVGELSNSNNGSTYLTVYPSGGTNSLPDLVTNSITLSTQSVALGNSFTATATVISRDAVSDPSYVYYYLSRYRNGGPDDRLLGTAYYPRMGKDATLSRTKTLRVPSDMPTGQYYLLAFADGSHQVTESNEGNNSSYALFAVRSNQEPEPDLSVAIESLSKTSLNNGETTLISIDTINNGPARALHVELDILLSVDDQLGGDSLMQVGTPGNASPASFYLGALDQFGSYGLVRDIFLPNNTAPGNYWIIVRVRETSINNTDWVAYPITVFDGTPDAVPANVAVNVNFATLSDYFARLAVKNVGTATINTVWGEILLSEDNVVSSDDHRITYVLFRDILAGETSPSSTVFFDLPSGYPSGNYYVLFNVDPSNNVAESIESNNMVYIDRMFNASGKRSLDQAGHELEFEDEFGTNQHDPNQDVEFVDEFGRYNLIRFNESGFKIAHDIEGVGETLYTHYVVDGVLHLLIAFPDGRSEVHFPDSASFMEEVQEN